MNILSLLDILEDELEKGVTIPFAAKAMIDRDSCFEIIRDIRLNLPEEIKQGEWIKKERQRILVDAQKEAESIVKEAEDRLRSMIDDNEIAQRAYQQSKDIIDKAQENAREIRLGAKEYANSLLEEIEGYLQENLETIKSNRAELNTTKKKQSS